MMADAVDVCIVAAEEAQPLRRSGKLLASRDKLLVCAREECPAQVRKDCTAWLAEVDRAIPSVVVHAKDARGQDLAGAELTVDDVPRGALDGRAITLDPGEHTVVVRHRGETQRHRLLLSEGEARRVIDLSFHATATARPAAPSRSIPASTWLVGAAGLVAVSTGVYLWLLGTGDRSAMRETCYPHCPRDDVDGARTKLIAGDIVFGVGIAALAAALWIGVSARPSPTKMAFTF